MAESKQNGKLGVVGLCGQSLFFSLPHLPTEGETAHATRLRFEMGGKGFNQALAGAAIGVECFFAGKVGKDEWGRACHEHLAQSNVFPLLCTTGNTPTAVASISTSAAGHNQVVVYGGASATLHPDDLARLLAPDALCGCRMLLAQLEVDVSCLAYLLDVGERENIPVLLNPAPARLLPRGLLGRLYAITPNEGEAHALLGTAPGTVLSPAGLCAGMHELGVKRAAITLGPRGALVCEGEAYRLLPAHDVPQVVDTTGAGDVFNGVLAACLVQGMPFMAAAVRGVVASGLSTQTAGVLAALPSAAQVRQQTTLYLAKNKMEENEND